MVGNYYYQTVATNTITGQGIVFYGYDHTYTSRSRVPPKSNMSRRERALSEMQRQLAEDIRKFGKELLEHRLAREEAERKVLLDAKSRRCTPHASTKRRDSRRLQTYEAAMAVRQMVR